MTIRSAAEAAARAHVAALRDLDDREAAVSLPTVRPESVPATVAGELRTLLRPLEEASAWDEREAATLERAAAEWRRGRPTLAAHDEERAATLRARAALRRKAANAVVREIEGVEGAK